jgi:hypothetical protein
MSKHVALSSVAHKTLRINTQCTKDPGDEVMSCITVPTEYRKIQNHYPIFFQLNKQRDEFRSIALFGFEQGENLYLNNGEWTARYKPLAMDIKPFLIGRTSESDAEAKVHLDLDSPRIDDQIGQRLFDDQGNSTDYLESISNKLGELHDGYQRTSDFIKCLQKHKLLEPLVLEITLKDGTKNRLVGFHTINERKLSELEGLALEELNTKGYLMPVYMAIASLSNIARLVECKNESLVDAG